MAAAYDRMNVYDWVVERTIEKEGITPTLREIASGMGIGSTSTTARILNDLEDQHLITRSWGACRSIQIQGARWVPPAGYGE